MEKSKELKKLVATAELQNYFIKVRELTLNGKQFCVNLDMVWQLAYSRKDAAVRELKDKFKEGEHYLYNSIPVATLNGGVSRKARIMLTSECLEHFVASKVPAVFEVYRRVFHEAMDKETMVAELPNFKNPAEAARAWAHQFEMKEEARAELIASKKEVKKIKPLAIYAKDVLKAKGAYTMEDMAKLFNFNSRAAFVEALVKAKVLLKCQAPYKLASKYLKNHPKYVEYGTFIDGRKYAKTTMTWNEEGKRFIASLKASGKL